jgi:lipoyl(octanoyl) transferase
MSLTIRDLGIFRYDDAFALQRRTVERLQMGGNDEALFLLEHPHVITLGRNASESSLIAAPKLLSQKGVTLVETDRGGDATYHGPGQLVGYPIIKLEEERHDIRRFVTDLEEALIRTLGDFSIVGERHDEHRGVWLRGRKIASVGIRISRWVTSHGFALNVDTDLSYFSLIHPCGITGCEMTSMTRELGETVDMASVKERFVEHFSAVFDRTALQVPMQEIGANG